MIRAVSGLGTGQHRPAYDELLAQYAAYRRRQARALIRLLPREAVRPLYRRAREGGSGEGSPSDPLALLVSYCESLLPLPPFETWCDDLSEYPVAHLHDLDDSADAPTAEAPVTVEARLFSHDGHPWIAYLRSFRDEVAWRGHIAFEDRRSGRVHRTALIFRESDPADLRERFLSFESATLEAFLRSALP